MKKAIVTATGCIEFTFDGLEPVVFDVTSASTTNRNYAMLHGFAARIGDNAAITKSAENGYRVTEAMRRDAVMELVEHYRSGSVEWSPKAKAKGPAQNPLWVRLAEARGVSYETIAAEKAEADLAELMALTTMIPPRG